MSVGRICSREVTVAYKHETLAQAAQLMRSQHVGDVVVVEERDGVRVPVGLLTDRDIVIEVVAKNVDAETITVGDAMSADLLVAHEQDAIDDTLRRMRARGVRRVPVVDSVGALIGVLSTDDVVRLLAEELDEIGKLLARQPQQEAATRRV